MLHTTLRKTNDKNKVRKQHIENNVVMNHLKKFIILGPINTGTNLIEKIIRSSRQVVKSLNKHQIDKNKIIIMLNSTIMEEETICFIMYKPIYNWIASVQKESYFIERTKLRFPKQNSQMQSFSSCILDYNISCYGKEYDNIIEVYNSYYQAYLDLMKEQKYHKKIVFLDYYQCIDGHNGFEYFQNKYREKISMFPISLSQDKYMTILNKPSKIHGQSVNNFSEALYKKEKNRNYYYDKIQNDTSLKNFIKIEDLCKIK